jgi:hypothetical protein
VGFCDKQMEQSRSPLPRSRDEDSPALVSHALGSQDDEFVNDGPSGGLLVVLRIATEPHLHPRLIAPAVGRADWNPSQKIS